MLFNRCAVEDVWAIEPEPHMDSRGRFMRSWCQQEFAKHGLEFTPVQGNMAMSRYQGTLRGLHYQTEPALEAKLVRCTRGVVFDVALDLRPGSQTYLKWVGEMLSAENGKMLLVPEGCAHGCLSLEDESEILYLTSAYYAPDCATGVRYDDPAFGIDWPIEISVVSEQDQNWSAWDDTGPGRN